MNMRVSVFKFSECSQIMNCTHYTPWNHPGSGKSLACRGNWSSKGPFSTSMTKPGSAVPTPFRTASLLSCLLGGRHLSSSFGLRLRLLRRGLDSEEGRRCSKVLPLQRSGLFPAFMVSEKTGFLVEVVPKQHWPTSTNKVSSNWQ